MRLTRNNSLALEFKRPRAGGVEFVSAAKAFHPPSESINVGGSTLVFIHQLFGEPGDLMLVVEWWNGGSINAPPSGWTAVHTSGNARVSKHVITDSEPDSYQFSNAQAGWGRSGCSILLRGGTTVEDSATNSDTFTVPTVTASTPGAALVATSSCNNSGGVVEKYAANSPLTLGQRHISDGTRAYVLAAASAIAYELDVAGSLSGRSFSRAATASLRNFGVVVAPD